MITIRRSETRGHADRGWLNSHHTFTFGSYQDDTQMGFRSLRVINEDTVAPAKGFGAHGHRDMEIISYVLKGKLGHKDSMGHEEVLGPNEIQVMSAGTGVVHSEFNASETEPVHFLQIWIEPEQKSLPSSYQQLAFDPAERADGWKLLVAPQKEKGVAQINQDASVSVTMLRPQQQRTYALLPNRHAWVHVISGRVALNGEELKEGDAAALSNIEQIALTGELEGTEVLLFDLA